MRVFKFVGPGLLALAFVTGCGGSATTPTIAPRSSTAAAATVAPAPVTTPGAVATTAPVAATAPAGGTTAPAGAGNLCSLLTPADLSTAIGQTYLPGMLDAAGQCNWNTDESGVNSGNLVIAAIQQEPLSYVQSSYGTGGVATTVNGHAAFWNPTTGLQSMWVDIGNGNVLVLSFPRSSDLPASFQAKAQHLAEVAVGNM